MRVELERVRKSYRGVRALDDVTLTLEPGHVVAVLGLNGAGKTTLLRCLAGVIAPDRGAVCYDGDRFRRDRLDLRRRLGFIPDFPVFLPRMSPAAHIAMALRLYEADRPGVEDRVVTLLEELDLLALCETPLAVLSRGQRYKADLARLLAVDPELWLLDEPFASGMDPRGLLALRRHVREATARGRTVLFSTQILEVVKGIADRVCVIDRGAAEMVADVDEVNARYRPDGDEPPLLAAPGRSR